MERIILKCNGGVRVSKDGLEGMLSCGTACGPDAKSTRRQSVSQSSSTPVGMSNCITVDITVGYLASIAASLKVC